MGRSGCARGTQSPPAGARVAVRIKIGIPEGYNPPLVKEIDVWFPEGVLYNGGRYPTCSCRLIPVRVSHVCSSRSPASSPCP
jgi:hypothetical protein